MGSLRGLRQVVCIPLKPGVGAGTSGGQGGMPPSKLATCQVWALVGRPFQSSTLHGKCWAASTAAKAIITSSMLAIGMLTRIAFFCASSIMTMNWGMPSTCTRILHHICAQSDHVDDMKLSAAGFKEGLDLDYRDLCVKVSAFFKPLYEISSTTSQRN